MNFRTSSHIHPFQIPNAKVLDAFPSPVDRRNILFRNIDSSRIAGTLTLLKRNLTLPREQPVDKDFRRIGMGACP